MKKNICDSVWTINKHVYINNEKVCLLLYEQWKSMFLLYEQWKSMNCFV